MPSIFKRSGGYRKLYSFNFATIVHLGAIGFCKRFIPWQEDTGPISTNSAENSIPGWPAASRRWWPMP